MKSILSLCVLLIVSCTPKVIPIKGTYQTPPFTFESNNNKDVVWDKIIDLFAQKGLPIKIIDRSSGLIISEESELIWSYEKEDGTLYGDRAHVVLPKVISGSNKKPISQGKITGEWNVRIKELPENKTSININLVNIKSYPSTATGMLPQTLRIGTDAKSTGNFEKMIFDYIK